MSSIHSWLQRLGLDRYAETFAAEDIDVDVLSELTEADLVELGVSFGDRKKLLRAIAALSGPGAEGMATRRPAAATGDPGEDAGAEQRHLTVMFCDLVGSTELAARYDPEDLRTIVRAYQDACAGVVARLEGYVARYMGDGVLVYFGFPRAHEDDAERAIRAGLEIVEAVGKLRPQDNLKLRTRIGIATGPVIVGDLIGTGSAQEFAAVGETPNLAARLQAVATPDSVVIDSTTHSLARAAFDCDDLGPQTLKGIARPAPAWRVLRPRDLERRMEALQADDLVPFVNRTGEITLLLDRWRMASSGHGQIVLLSGEAGIGKSRLLRAFVERLGDQDFVCHSFHCTPFHRSSALFPLIERLRRLSGLASDDAPMVALAKLRGLAKQASGNPEELLRLMAPLFLLDTGEEEALADGQADMDRLLELLVREIEVLARKRPLLLIIEDLHWIDPSSLELLQRLSLRIAGLPILLALTLRPEAEAEMRHLFPATGLMLNGLQRPESETIIRHIARQKALPQELVDTIAERTDGVALFIEQLTKAVLESGAVVEQGDRYAMAGDQPSLSIPTTLRGSLLARLDRYPGAREVAQIGAVVGREFSYRMMAAISTLPEDDLKFALKRLVEAELLYQAGTPPKATYRFKHALVQEMAYNSLLKKRRRRLHGAIAAYLEDRSPHLAVVEPELLAYHFTESSQLQRAIAYRLQAGERAIQRSAMTEAATEIELGLRLLPAITDEAEHAALELQLRVAQATALRAVKGTGAPETGAAWARARALCGPDNKSVLSRILYGSFLFHQGNAQLKEARALGESLLELGRQLGDERALLRGHMAIGRTAFGLGDFPEARRHLEESLALNDPERHKSGSEADRPESPVIDLCYLSWTSFVMGRPATALKQCRQSMEVAEASGGWYDLVVAHGNACYLHQLRDEPALVAACARKVIEVASDKGYPHWLSLGSMFEGWVTATGGDLAAGIATFETALAEHRATGEVIEVCFYLGVLAEMLGRAGRIDDGLARIAEALELVEQTGERWYEAELHRGRGELLRRASQPDEAAAEVCFLKAREQAREQGARLWELRAATSLARLRGDQGRAEEAREILEPLRDAFEAPEFDDDSADRRAAEALLKRLPVKAPR